MMFLRLSVSAGFLRKSRVDGLGKFQVHNFLTAYGPEEDRSFFSPRVFLIMQSKH